MKGINPVVAPGEPLESVAVVGSGRVARALLHHLDRAGVTVLQIARRPTGRWPAVSLREPAPCQDLIVVAVADPAIRVVSELLVLAHSTPTVAVHTAGARPVEDLEPLQVNGWMTGTFHPAAAFPDDETEFEWRGQFVSISGHASAMAIALGERLGAETFQIDEGHRVAYHLGCSLAAAGVTTLLHESEQTLIGAGVERALARRLACGLASGVISTHERVGGAASLTGSVVRGDSAAVSAHLEAISGREIEALVHALGRRTLALAELSGRISKREIADLEARFQAALQID